MRKAAKAVSNSLDTGDTAIYEASEEGSSVIRPIKEVALPPVLTGHKSNSTKYNFNDDKASEAVFGFESGDESWEILNNTSNRVIWKDDDYSDSDWLNDFEGRYPDGNEDPTNLAALAAWLVTTDQSAATGDPLASSVTYEGVTYTTDSAAYRLAKFKDEFEDHIEKSSALFYYLFTELFLMVDSRAKNAFPSFFRDDKWCFLPYDFDTAIGINNEGALVFDYSLEDIDTTASGADVFNGQQSVLWVNIRQAFFDDIKAMYQNLRSTGKLSYTVVENMFEEHQDKWSEAIFNEDAWFKYINPLTEDGSGSYLAMAQGSKAEQRKWWLYNRFRYLDSKYNAGDALTDVIQVRGYAKDDITVTPYADIYPSVKYGSYLVSARGARNTATTLVCPLDSVNDTEIYIYSASQLSSVGDLSGLKVGFADFSMATRLQSIKVGSNATGYTNGNLTEFYAGNNTLLNSVDVRNCTALSSAIDLSGCTNIEHVYFDGTAITACSLPNGGILKTLHLPSTITNLTLRNQSGITDFTMAGYSNITTLRLENVANMPVESIITSATSLNRVRLVGMEWTSSSEANLQATITRLRACGGLDINGNNTANAVVTGRVHVSSISGELLAEINTYFPDLVVVLNGVAQYLVRFMNDNGTLVYAMVVPETDSAIDPVDAGLCDAPTKTGTDTIHYRFTSWSEVPTYVVSNMTVVAQFIEQYRVRYLNWDDSVLQSSYITRGENAPYTQSSTPTRPSTAQYIYTFSTWSAPDGGWTNITSPRDFVAQYNTTLRTYTVRFMNGSTVLQTINNVPYGSAATYTGSTPTHSNPDYRFIGWLPDGTNITGNTDCVAQFKDVSSPALKYLKGELVNYESSTATVVGNYAFYQYSALQTATTSASTIEANAFSICANLTTVDLTSDSAVTIKSSAFSSCSKLTAVIIRSSTVSALENTNAFASTPIGSLGEAAIYVPSNLVSAYKSASNWSTYATRIYPISSYPVTDFSTITDSWDEIFAAEEDGTYRAKYGAGDTKLLEFDYNNQHYKVYMEIVAIDAEELSNGLANAKISWVADRVFISHRMNASNTTSGGWPSTEMRSWLRSDIYPALPSNIRAAIKEVSKPYMDYDSGTTETSEDTIWIPSAFEVFGGSSFETDGVWYASMNRIKTVNGSATGWWLRSASSTYNFYYVGSGGIVGNGNAGNSYGVVFGFCT